jgi:kynurenine formamidase
MKHIWLMMGTAVLAAAAGFAWAQSKPAQLAAHRNLNLSGYRIVDLTYSFNDKTPYWPTATSGFQLQTVSKGPAPGGYFYSAYAYAAPEHGGTHLDAPVHFAEGRPSAERVGLERLIAAAVVIDVSEKAARDADYRLTSTDVFEFERHNGRINPGTIVLLRTGWGKHWPNKKAYLGDDTPGDATHLHFPSFGEDAAKVLVIDRRVAAIGVDVASIDYGQSKDFVVHRIAAAGDVPGLENLAGLDELPSTGLFVIALPMKIEGGSGGPLRAVALVPR